MDAAMELVDSADGQKFLLDLAKAGKLPAEAKLLVGPVLKNSQAQSVKSASEELFPSRVTVFRSQASIAAMFFE